METEIRRNSERTLGGTGAGHIGPSHYGTTIPYSHDVIPDDIGGTSEGITQKELNIKDYGVDEHDAASNYPKSNCQPLSMQDRKSDANNTMNPNGPKSPVELESSTTDAEGKHNLDSSRRKLPSLFSPQLKKERKILLKSILRIEILLIVIVLGILSLYWGGLASLLPNQRVLTVALVDFDGGEVGRTFAKFGMSAPRLTTETRSSIEATDGTDG